MSVSLKRSCDRLIAVLCHKRGRHLTFANQVGWMDPLPHSLLQPKKKKPFASARERAESNEFRPGEGGEGRGWVSGLNPTLSPPPPLPPKQAAAQELVSHAS